jgi:NADH-quinone oxidoreductase subunit K
VIYKIQILTNLALFLVSAMGILYNKKDILIIIMCIEIILLSVNLNFITFSSYLDNFIDQVFSFFSVLTVICSLNLDSA